MSFYVQVDQGDINRVLMRLRNVEKAQSHLKNAINRIGTQAMKMIRSGRGQGYAIKAGTFNASVKTFRARAGALNYAIKSKDRPHSLMEADRYKTKGQKAAVYRGAMKGLGFENRGVFQATMSNGFVGLFQRTGAQGIKDRLAKYNPSKHTEKIKTFYGPSVSKQLKQIWEGEVGGQRDMEGKVKQRLHDEIKAELAKLI